MAELQEVVMRVFHRLQILPERELASEVVYYKVVGLSMASHYSFAMQSRIAPISHMKMSELGSMYDRQLVLSDEGKTRQKYGPQPILFTEDQLRIMTFFIDYVRSPLQKRYPFLGDHDAFVYASYRNPDRVANCSRQLKKFFIHEAGYRHQSNLYYDLY